jgi:hypothetical protein
MTERKRTYQSKAQGPALRRLAPINNQVKPQDESELARLISQNPEQADQKIDLLYRLINHLKAL